MIPEYEDEDLNTFDFWKELFHNLKPPTKEELLRILRPVPTNPATPGFGQADICNND